MLKYPYPAGLIIVLEEILELAAREKRVAGRLLKELRFAEKQVNRLSDEIAGQSVENQELVFLLEVLTLKKISVSDKIIQAGLIDFALDNKISVIKESLQVFLKGPPVKVNNQLVKLVRKEQKAVLRYMNNLAMEEKVLFDLFLRAMETARERPESIRAAEDIIFRELSFTLKYAALGYKEQALADKLRAAVFAQT